MLANEQVIEGKGWRTGAPVERRKLTQWNLKITALRRRAAGAVSTRSSAGREGAPDAGQLDRQEPRRARLLAADRCVAAQDHGKLEIFTTRPDTLYGASFVALSAEHPLVAELADKDPGLQRFVAECRKTGTAAAEIETAEKSGYKLPLLAQASVDAGQDRCRSMPPTSC